MLFRISVPQRGDWIHVYAGILIFALNVGRVHMTPTLPDRHQQISPANLTIFQFAASNYSATPVPSVVPNATFPVYTPPFNSSRPMMTNEESCANCTRNATDLKGTGPQIKAEPLQNDTSPNPTKKEVHPSFFYKRGKMNIYYDKSRALVDIEVFQRYCRQLCECNDEGAIVPRERYGINHACGKQWQANRCFIVLGCYCTAELVQPVVEGEAATIEEYQAALDRIPQTVRNDNPDYFWRMNGLGRRPWEVMTWVASEMDIDMAYRPRMAMDGSGREPEPPLVPESEPGIPLSGPEPFVPPLVTYPVARPVGRYWRA
ncbi:hypothetical protein TWF192_009783 [Orbilia oligospora]|uniref:Uncharacterized protein n=1 Tax=Orbilia oligospora TaxID=2813651 RepID=A0A6G1MJZ1_ORBOL|nr:hypothetical protein TWF679_005473 [Orbilia oligospora]KAF3230379.1 hypothetical protein TWF191_010268 [Orbilia oligospora]KAF3260505.1 hypothetical protein TWF192_009783 [Orbilia oligospora]